jgi:hypothetical protein
MSSISIIGTGNMARAISVRIRPCHQRVPPRSTNWQGPLPDTSPS